MSKRFKPLSFDIKDEFKDAFEVVKLNVSRMQEVAQRIDATKPALFFILLAVLATNLGLVIFPVSEQIKAVFQYMGLVMFLLGLVLGTAFSVFYIWLLSFIAEKMFSGRAYFDQFLRVMGYGAVIKIVNIVPELGIISMVWYFIITWYVLRRLYRLPIVDSALTILLVMTGQMVLFKLLGGFGMMEAGMF